MLAFRPTDLIIHSMQQNYAFRTMYFISALLGLFLCILFDRAILCRSLQSVPVTPATAVKYDVLYIDSPSHFSRLIFAAQVRCNSRQPCGNCSQAGLSCTYDAIPQKKGPKGSRAKVISELREAQKQTDLAHHIENGKQTNGSPPKSPCCSPNPGLLTRELMESCHEVFFAHMYPTMPILHRDQLRQTVGEMGHSVEAYCLVTALCSFMLIQPGIAAAVIPIMDETSCSMTNPRIGQLLMDEVVRVRKGYDYVENPNVNTVITSFFLFGCCFGLNKQNTAWFHLREATALAQILGMEDQSTYLFGNVVETSRRRLLFWLLFITERWVHVLLSLNTLSLTRLDRRI